MRYWLLILLVSSQGFSEELTFKNRDKVVKVLTFDQLEKISPAKDVTVYEHHEAIEQAYRGFPATPLLDSVYGDTWKKAEEVLFTCLDGYQPTVPVENFEKYSAYFVFQRKGRDKFTMVNRFHNNELVELAPFYVIWDNLKSKEVMAKGTTGWPYQVTTVDLIDFSERFPNMAPPKTSAASVKRGFGVFRKTCMPCHTINGEGGTKAAVELNYPVNVTEYFKEAWLRKWITDPTSLRFNTTMPAFAKEDPTWKRQIDDIMAYLKAMGKNKRRPVVKN